MISAVQSERDSGKDIGEAKQEQSDEEMDSSPSRAGSTSSLTNQSSVGICLGSSKHTQTDACISPNDVVFVDEDLIMYVLSIILNMKFNLLLISERLRNLYRHIFLLVIALTFHQQLHQRLLQTPHRQTLMSSEVRDPVAPRS